MSPLDEWDALVCEAESSMWLANQNNTGLGSGWFVEEVLELLRRAHVG
jgi:hypothetical protein